MILFHSYPNLSHKINNLRAMSALFVLIYHYFIFFFTAQGLSALYSVFTPLEFPNQDLIQMVKDFPFDLGKFAVAEFFLISGFLVPSLIEKYPTRASFFKNRFFRLWPIYAIGLAINIIFIWGACLYNGLDFVHTLKSVIASFFCVRDFLGYPFITGIVWTFEIEVKFFLFCLVVYPLIQRPSPRGLLFLKTFLFFGCFYLASLLYEDQKTHFYAYQFFKILSNNLNYFCFLLIGMCFSFFLLKKISQKVFITFCILTSLFFLIESYLIFTPVVWFRIVFSFFPALFLFIWYIAKSEPHKSHHVPILREISEMSYPLYLIHAIPGYIIMYILYDYGFSLPIGIIVACLMSYVLTYVVHHYMEKPIRNKWSRKGNTFLKK
ncbi:MAG: acyltransferase [Proteobacteria bacterium]|nr:acyltransferase [Pseudomonadota bacterium]